MSLLRSSTGLVLPSYRHVAPTALGLPRLLAGKDNTRLEADATLALAAHRRGADATIQTKNALRAFVFSLSASGQVFRPAQDAPGVGQAGRCVAALPGRLRLSRLSWKLSVPSGRR